VVLQLQAQGLCSTVDGGGEIAVKKTSDFNDQYHIMISDGVTSAAARLCTARRATRRGSAVKMVFTRSPP
jgi:hypothetical protein